MAAGTAQESRLAIVIDTKSAEDKIKRLRAALSTLTSSASTAGAGADRLSASNSRVAGSAAAAAAANGRLSSSAAAASRSTSTAAAAAQRLSASTAASTTAVQRLTQSMGSLNGVFATFASSVGVLSVLKIADAMQSLNSKIKLATSSSEEYLAVQGRLRAMAQSNLTEYDSLVDLYASSRRALKQLGKTQNETLVFTENVTKAMFVGGGAAASQAAALVQLGQALASGVLRGDEFNSIAEQAPILLELVAEKMGVAQGALRKLAADGKISSKILYDAISDATEKLSDMAAKMPATMGQAFETVRNQYKYFIDDMLNSTGGFSSIVAGALIGLGENLNSLIPIIVAGGLAWGAYALATSAAVTTSVAAAITSITSMGYAFLSNTALMKVQILSYFELNAMIARYSTNMMIARLTVANYIDIVKTSIAPLQAKATVMMNSVKATLANISADIRHGQVIASLAGAIRAATVPTIERIAAIRASAAATLAAIGADIRHGQVVAALTGAITRKIAAMRAGTSAASIYSATLTGVAGTAAVAATAIKGLTGAVAKLGGIINAHPIMFLAVTLLSVVAATEDAEGKTRGFTGAMDSLAEAVKVVGSLFLDFVKFTIDGITSVGRVFGTFITSFVQNSESGANESSNMFAVFFSNTEGGFVGLLQVWARFSDLAAASTRNLIKSVVRGMSNLTKDVANKAGTMANVLVDAFEWAAGGIAKTLNFIGKGVGWAVQQLNKISPIQIAVEERDYVAPKLDRFIADRKLDIQGWSESMMPIMEDQMVNGLSGTVQRAINTTRIAAQQAKSDLDLVAEGMANIAEEDGKKKKKAKEKKEKKPKVLKDKEAEAYLKLIEAYEQQLASFDREIYDTMAAFNTELRKIGYEVDDVTGKFYELPDAFKDNLRKAASALDEQKMFATVRDTLNGFERQLALIGKDSAFEQWAYDLGDASNILSTMSDDLKNVVLEQASLLDASKLTYEANKSIESSIDGINKEIALMATSGSALDEFIYDLNNTSTYANASLESINALGDALTKLDNLKKGDALNGVMGEIAQESPMGKIEADYQRRLEIIDDYESQWTDLVGVHSAERAAIEQSYQDAKRDLMLTQGEALFGDLAGLAKGFAGEQSGIYKGLFAVEKGFAIAQSAIAIQQSIAKAMALGFPQNIPVIGQAIAQGAGIMSSIKGITAGFKQGGYTGNMGVNQVAGAVHGQEYVFDAQATKRIGVDNLNAMRSGKSVGGDVQVNIINNSSARVEASSDGQTITISDVNNAVDRKFDSLANPNSHASKAINRNLNATRRR